MKKILKSLALLTLLTSSTTFAAPLGSLIMRVYLPENGDISKVELPNLIFEFVDGSTKEVRPCINPQQVTSEYISFFVEKQPNCAWALGLNTTRMIDPNIALPDTNASYWVTNFIPDENLKKIMIKGTYPNTRYLSFNAYNAKGSSFESTVDNVIYKSSIPDYKIQPDTGYQNPWQQTGLSGGKYTIHVVRNPKKDAPMGANTLLMPPAMEGGALTLLTQMPNIKRCPNDKCFPINFFKASKEIAAGSFPNSDSAYLLSMVKPDLQEVLVIQGKMPTFAAGNTPSEWPAGKQVRYFSICNNLLMRPYPVVMDGCLHDSELKLDINNNYTVVVSHIKPVLHKHDWLPFSKLLPLQDHALLVRNMVSNPAFTQSTLDVKDETNNWQIASSTMGQYYPTIKRCSRLDYALKGSRCTAVK